MLLSQLFALFILLPAFFAASAMGQQDDGMIFDADQFLDRMGDGEETFSVDEFGNGILNGGDDGDFGGGGDPTGQPGTRDPRVRFFLPQYFDN